METNDTPKTIEERFEAIEEILGQLEKPDVPLDKSFELYKKGMDELQKANATIEQTRKAVMAISSDGTLEPFDEADKD